jgi:hypothetical protein
MNTINLEAKSDTPKIIFDPENEIFEISGRSLPEDATVFYDPILEWLKEYSKNPLSKTIIQFKLNYFNTASSKMLLDILLIFEDMKEDGKDVLVKWFYPTDDEDMQEAGEEYDEIVEVPFEHIEYS